MEPSNHEVERIKLLHALNLLDTDPEPVFDRITRTLSKSLDVPVALLSLVDIDRQWFKSRIGMPITETSRDIAFCDTAIRQPEILLVPDAHEDTRFADNPLVTGEEQFRFYAGIPLRSIDGYAVGTLCALDRRPRQLTEQQLQTLQDLADMATREIQIREAAVRSRSQLEDSDARIEASESRFRTIFERAGVGIALVAPDGHFIRVNQALCEITGYDAAGLLECTFQDITYPDDLDSDLQLLQHLISDDLDRYQLEKRYIQSNGEIIWVNLLVTKHVKRQGEIDYFIAIIEDINARKVAENELQALRDDLEHQVTSRTQDLRRVNRALSDAMLQQIEAQNTLARREAELSAVLENASDAFVSVNANGCIRAWNKQAEETFGWSPDEAMGNHIETLLIPPARRPEYRADWHEQAAQGAGSFGKRLELEALRKDGQTVPVEVRISTVTLPDQKIFNAFLHDISERKLTEQRREQEALHDALTGLPNRRAMYERIPAALGRAKRHGTGTALLFIDLDGFKQVNDQFGHDAGDQLLCTVAERLRANVRVSDGVFRLAGDEFTVLLEDVSGGQDSAARIAEKLLAAIAEPVPLSEGEASVGASIGVAISDPDDTLVPEEWVKAADTAMYDAKRTGKGRIVFV
ncbi:sensor domain-containing diguanylate cyclase [Pseudomonas matsuisoli]|uniref:PAS domain S-box-containing protein/diguanylate cyclase (GGDEF) domain-containing protein n=1 Tax=Pseudomonas matsuisoli TaxID=1515666 RepID=A0A917V0J3_9PSED|nr:PAS domain S-box protein [Pseudomonas matsuisoli]GGK04851.1 hypothetical protein GCM10009304_33650 [Pseudomonas matsuisoli]